jgi:hypothetical protein
LDLALQPPKQFIVFNKTQFLINCFQKVIYLGNQYIKVTIVTGLKTKRSFFCTERYIFNERF